jgi:hypothetical protein
MKRLLNRTKITFLVRTRKLTEIVDKLVDTSIFAPIECEKYLDVILTSDSWLIDDKADIRLKCNNICSMTNGKQCEVNFRTFIQSFILTQMKTPLILYVPISATLDEKVSVGLAMSLRHPVFKYSQTKLSAIKGLLDSESHNI